MKNYFKMPLLFFVPILMGFCGCFSVKSNENFTYLKLKPETYDSLLRKSKNNYLIDVRTGKEYSKSHMTDAVNFSFLAFHFRRNVKDFDRNRPVFIYCQTCHRSPLAARKLKHMGFSSVYDLKGGYRKWIPAN
jgi:rhodanese-related sulfurtransferase